MLSVKHISTAIIKSIGTLANVNTNSNSFFKICYFLQICNYLNYRIIQYYKSTEFLAFLTTYLPYILVDKHRPFGHFYAITINRIMITLVQTIASLGGAAKICY